jgi:hypothetical protein
VEHHGAGSDDSFDDDDTLSLFNDENVLRQIEDLGDTKKRQTPPAGKKKEPSPILERTSTPTDKFTPQSQDLSEPVAAVPVKQCADQLILAPTAKSNAENKIKPPLNSMANASANVLTATDITSGKGPSTSKTPHAPLQNATMSKTTWNSLDIPVDEFQDGEDIFAGLCTQDFKDDDDENKEPARQPTSPRSKNPNKQNARHVEQLPRITRPPLRDLGQPISVIDTKKMGQKLNSKSQQKIIPAPQQSTTVSTEDDFGSFSFSDEDLLRLGV